MVLRSVPRPETPDKAAQLERIARRWSRFGQLDHPNLAWSHGIVPVDGQLQVVREYLDLPTLNDWLVSTPDVGIRRRVALGIVTGLAAARDYDLGHGHLTADNVFVDSEGNAVITDFEVATVASGQPVEQSAVISSDLAALGQLFTDLGIAESPLSTEMSVIERLVDRHHPDRFDEPNAVLTTLTALWSNLPEESPLPTADRQKRGKLLLALGSLTVILLWIVLLVASRL